MPDWIDYRILELLQEDAKLTIKEISDKLNLSKTPVFERIKKLEREKFIKGYQGKLDRRKLGLNLVVFCNVSLDAHQKAYLETFESDVQKLPEVVACYHVAGMYDYLLQVMVTDMISYQEFVTQKLASLPHINQVQSSFVMTEVKEFGSLPVILKNP